MQVTNAYVGDRVLKTVYYLHERHQDYRNVKIRCGKRPFSGYDDLTLPVRTVTKRNQTYKMKFQTGFLLCAGCIQNQCLRGRN